jgi:ketosteroid isomerase-like protein
MEAIMFAKADAVSATETFQRFVAAINGHDVEALTSLMTSDHLFVDSMGNRVQGAESMQTGWRGYFAMCPDYWIRVRNLLSEQETILATGEAGGTIDGIPWQMPAAWQAVFIGGQVSEWRIFADNKPVYEIIGRRKR